MSIYIIFSGLIGSVIGVIVTIGLYWYNRYISTRRALVDRLTILLHDVHWNCDKSDIFKTWDASLKDIWVLYNAFMDFATYQKRQNTQSMGELQRRRSRDSEEVGQ